MKIKTRNTEKRYKTITSKTGIKMIVSEVLENGMLSYSVYTQDEWTMGKGYRSAEFEYCTEFEAISQAINF